jgi:hypothetical protein
MVEGCRASQSSSSDVWPLLAESVAWRLQMTFLSRSRLLPESSIVNPGLPLQWRAGHSRLDGLFSLHQARIKSCGSLL